MANHLEVVMNKLSQILVLSGVMFAGHVLAGEKVDSSLPIEGVMGVSIENIRGHVHVIGSSRDTVSVKGELEEEAEKLIFEKSGNQINVKVKVPQKHNHGRNDDGSHLTVYVPENMAINFQGVSSDFTVDNISHSVDARTVSGDIKATDLSQDVELESVSGNVSAQGLSGKVLLSSISGDVKDRNSSGRIYLKAISGSIDTISSAQEVSLNGVSGDIDFELSQVEDLNINVVSGNADGKINLADNGRVKMSGVSSDLTLAFTNEVNANFKLNASAGGRIINDLTNDEVKRAKYGPSSKIKFSTGNGSASVKASVVSGTIKVTRD
jgi:DUF4097 and DUF4098 domain-containing protein YvlB